MIPMMMATIGGTVAAREKQQRRASLLRQTLGFAIVASGLAVIVAQALQHAPGG